MVTGTLEPALALVGAMLLMVGGLWMVTANAKLAVPKRGQHPLPCGITQHGEEPRHLSVARHCQPGPGRTDLLGMNT